MKAIILAGGLGTRLGDYTRDLPKCMLNFKGKTLLQRQIETYRICGVHDIIVIRKHLADRINISGVRYIDETDYSTHMVVGLFQARHEFNDDIIMSYGDILFETRILNAAIKSTADIGIVADTDWKAYWIARYGTSRKDSESFVIGEQDRVISLGMPDPPDEEMDARYVGMIRFSKHIWPEIEKIYDRARKEFWKKTWYTSKSFKKAYMTDLVQALIDNGLDVIAIKVQKGWLEFDTAHDYAIANDWLKQGDLKGFIRLESGN